MKKCTENKPCQGAMKISSVGDPDAVGLNVTDRIRLKDSHRNKGQLYRFPRKSEHKGFVWLNFCPWCGIDIRFKPSKRAATEGGEK
jgi:hypothetical protein